MEPTFPQTGAYDLLSNNINDQPVFTTMSLHPKAYIRNSLILDTYLSINIYQHLDMQKGKTDLHLK